MRIHPAIAALRGAHSSQRPHPVEAAATSLRQAREDWLAQPNVSAIGADVQRYAAGADIENCIALASLLTNPAKASDFVEAITRSTLHAFGAFPLGETPYRYRVSRGFAMIQLIENGGATLSLAAYEPVPGGEAPTYQPASLGARATPSRANRAARRARCLTLRRRC